MKKKIGLLLCLCLLTCLVLTGCGKKTKKYVGENFTAYEITHVDIYQKSTNNFDFSVNSNLLPGNDSKIYITRYDYIPNDATAIPYQVENNIYKFTTEVVYDYYYIWVKNNDARAVLPMMRPQMAPSLTVDQQNYIMTYNFVNGTSWSSFCDPTGKSIYKNNKPVYDDSATLVAKNINISGVDSTTDPNGSAENPYYFVVLTAKNGIVTYVSAPIVTYEYAFSDVKVNFEQNEDKIYLVINGKFAINGDVAADIYSADTKLGKVTEIIGNYVSGEANDEFETKVDISQIVTESGSGIWFDIKLATTSGARYELPQSVANMSETISVNGVTFEFKSWNNILKLNYGFYDYTVTEVKIDTTSIPTLIVKGEIFENNSISSIKIHTDYDLDGQKKHLLWDNISTDPTKFEFEIKLTDLPVEGTPWCWFHIYTYSGNSTIPNQADLNRGALIEIGTTYTYNGIVYTIQAYQGTGVQLVIQATASQGE